MADAGLCFQQSQAFRCTEGLEKQAQELQASTAASLNFPPFQTNGTNLSQAGKLRLPEPVPSRSGEHGVGGARGSNQDEGGARQFALQSSTKSCVRESHFSARDLAAHPGPHNKAGGILQSSLTDHVLPSQSYRRTVWQQCLQQKESPTLSKPKSGGKRAQEAGEVDGRGQQKDGKKKADVRPASRCLQAPGGPHRFIVRQDTHCWVPRSLQQQRQSLGTGCPCLGGRGEQHPVNQGGDLKPEARKD